LIFICADDDLNLIPFEILVDETGGYLIERHIFNYLPSGRELIRSSIKKKTKKEIDTGEKVLMGNPDFGLILKRSKPRLKRIRDYDVKLAPLPSTEQEVLEISNLFAQNETFVYTGGEACEKVLRSVKSPQILHLATHGFFIPMKSTTSNENDSSNDRGIDLGKKGIITEFENPLLCSGIALAGFNKAINSNGLNDGVVTAEEVLSLNLVGTELVTLSACETGLGKVGVGQGVLGLRSAFTRAGAAALVMSLWKVPDKETKDLMVDFYTNIAKAGMNKNEALRKAALAVMKNMKNKHGHTHPRFWGGFIFSGAAN
jgi:CHAT domain-containing protein